MSWQTDITQAIANLTQRLNDITTSAKKIYELTWQNILNPASKIHVSNSENQSEFITVQQILDAAISYKQNELIESTVSVVGNDVTVDSGAKWIINNINHELAADFEETIPYAETGNTRNDILVGNESNLIIRVVGPETEGISPTPNTPLNTVLITTINVTDSTISDVPVVPDTDLNTTDILNVSTVPGATTTDALNYLKDNSGGLLLQQEFIWTSGVQTFTLDYDYAQVFAVLIRGVQAHSSQYTLVPTNQVTILNPLNVDDYITILYAKTSVGVVTTYSKAEIDAIIASIVIGGGGTGTVTEEEIEELKLGNFNRIINYWEEATILGYVLKNGTLSASDANWRYSDFIESAAGNEYDLRLSGHPAINNISFYNSYEVFISGEGVSGSDTVFEENVIAPSGTAYVRFSGGSDSFTSDT